MIGKITLEVLAGTNIADACREAWDLSDRYGGLREVWFNFNGIDMCVTTASDVSVFVDHYTDKIAQSAREHRESKVTVIGLDLTEANDE